MKKKLSLIFIAILMIFTLIACGKNETNQQVEEKTYNISYDENEFYDLEVASKAKENEEITVKIKNINKIIVISDVLYNNKSSEKISDTTYTFKMPNCDVKLDVKYSIDEILSDNFASVDENDKLLYIYDEKLDNIITEKREILVTFNMNYMTILKSSIVSTNQDIIPNDAIEVDEITSMDLVGSSGSNEILQAKLLIDSKKIKVGKTYLILEFANGNVSSQKSTLVIEVTVKSRTAYKINYQKNDDYEVFIRDFAAPTEEVYFSVEAKNNGITIKDVYSNDVTIEKVEDRFHFIMPEKDVNIIIDTEYKEIVSDNFASYNGDKVIYTYNELLDSLYFRILGIKYSEKFKTATVSVKSTNEKVIPSEAISYQNKTEFEMILGATFTIDSKKIKVGETTLIFNIVADSKTATIIVNLKVEDRVAYKINATNDDFVKLSISKGSIPGEKVAFSIQTKFNSIEVVEILSDDVTISKDGANYYTFVMPQKEVTIEVKYKVNPQTSDGIVSGPNIKSIKMFDPSVEDESTRYEEFEVTFDARYMTICQMKVTATNPNVIDVSGITKKDILDMDLVGMSGTNEVRKALIKIDRTLIKEGETYLIFEFKNGNVNNEKGTLLFNIRVYK